jgi:hypothetical protein
MRKSTKAVLGLAVGAILGFAGAANAAITVTSTRTPGTGAYLGKDIVRFFAAFSPTSAEAVAGANGLQGVKATLTIPSGTFSYVTGQYAGAQTPTNPDVDPFGGHSDDAFARTSTDRGDPNSFPALGSSIFVYDTNGFGYTPQAMFVDGVAKAPTAVNNTGASNGLALFQNAKSFRVEGVVLSPDGVSVAADTKAKTALAGTPGAGALFAVAVVPSGTNVNAAGAVSGDKGAVNTFDVTDPGSVVPEPATLGVIGMGGMALFGRRRRKA